MVSPKPHLWRVARRPQRDSATGQASVGGNAVKLTIDLEDAWADDQSIADAIREAVLGTIKNQVQAAVRDELKQRYNELRAAVAKRVEQNMKHLQQEVLK